MIHPISAIVDGFQFPSLISELVPELPLFPNYIHRYISPVIRERKYIDLMLYIIRLALQTSKFTMNVIGVYQTEMITRGIVTGTSVTVAFHWRTIMSDDNYQWSDNDARTNLLHAEVQFARKVKSFWSGFLDFALRDNVLEVAFGLM